MKSRLLAVLFGFLALSGIVALSVRADDLEVNVGFNGDLYTSAIVITSTLKDEVFDEPEDADAEDAEEAADEKDITQVGDPYGVIDVFYTADEDNQEIEIEVSSSHSILPSTTKITLENAGEEYCITPMLKYDYDHLLSIKQPAPEDVTVKVTSGDTVLGEKTQRVTVRAINDVILCMSDEDGQTIDTTFMFAAYVNENHPVVDEILAEALAGSANGSLGGDNDEDTVNSFAGYQKSKEDVVKELALIWNTLSNRGFHYVDISRSSTEDQNGVASQYVRFIGESTKNSQANCVEGSCLFASICRKLGMDAMLVTIPGHMFVGVFLDANHESFLPIETTMLGSSTIEEAVEVAGKEFDEHVDALKKSLAEHGAVDDCMLIDISQWRKNGVLPISESGSTTAK